MRNSPLQREIASKSMSNWLHRMHSSGEMARLRKEQPERYTRLGAQNGSTRADDSARRAVARLRVDEFMQMMEDNGYILPDDKIKPGSDADLAKRTIKKMIELVEGPTDHRTKIAAAAQILPYTKAKPAQKTDLTVSGPEEWLKKAIAENERRK